MTEHHVNVNNFVIIGEGGAAKGTGEQELAGGGLEWPEAGSAEGERQEGNQKRGISGGQVDRSW